MIAYYVQIALLGFRRSPGLAVLMIVIMGVGVAASMTTYAVFRAVSGNPLPDRSAQLFVPQIDSLGPQRGTPGNKIPDELTYADAMALMRARAAQRQTAIYPIADTIVPHDDAHRAFAANGYAAYADFFPMFEVPFLFGHGWSDSEDSARANVIAISRRLNNVLFGGTNSVGRMVELHGRDYRIVGVVDGWNPQPRFYDVSNGFGFADEPDFYLPFTRAVDQHLDTNGNNACSGSTKAVAPGWDGWLHSECVWVSLWVQLPDAKAVSGYGQFLRGYADQQQRSGRFHWSPQVRLSDLMTWLDYEGVVPPETWMSLLVAVGFLVVCLVNTVGLLLARIMRRAGEIGVRRALGASRGDICGQFLAEAALVGMGGGVCGLALTGLGMLGTDLLFDPAIARLARIDARLVAMTLLLAVAATVIAGIYPALRAARVQPSWQLKSQ
ncbi:ABC transporter permease [Dyella mobilis]|uniref:ABC transporter permease n=1 Tax=Dyella mobilis TaxID=1849582 RepID=A0ABS2KMZ0_9GAMM|nr:FtsX-like permease family protein [Dyella mobilis]MBM7132253.1 ABC transporter permease [Dyella mobilis]GLQ95761.1 ABC transporter ATP-binding protein [Dyella mobilis]